MKGNHNSYVSWTSIAIVIIIILSFGFVLSLALSIYNHYFPSYNKSKELFQNPDETNHSVSVRPYEARNIQTAQQAQKQRSKGVNTDQDKDVVLYGNSLPITKGKLFSFIQKYLLRDPPLNYTPLSMKDKYELSCATQEQDLEIKQQAPYLNMTDLSLEIPDYFYRQNLKNGNVLSKVIPQLQTPIAQIPYLKMGKFEKVKLGKFTLYQINESTWHEDGLIKNPTYFKNRFDSPIANVNNGLRDLLIKFNKIYIKNWNKKNDDMNPNGISIPTYALYSHRLTKIEKSSNGYYRYLVVGRFFRQNSDIYYDIFVKFIASPDASNKSNRVRDEGEPFYYEKVEPVGGGTLDKVLLHNGFRKADTQLNLNPYYKNDGPIVNDNNLVDIAIKSYKHNKNIIDKLDTKHACFNSDPLYYENPSAPGNYVIYSSNKKDCESKLDMYGRPKPHGVWDKPCSTDRDCIFNEANKNYPNQFGKCMSDGRCQLPINMKHMGYHFYAPIKSAKPFCYNCGSKKWKAFTDLGDCCEEQKDKTKYPFLQTPDYAFKGDYETRYQHYLEQNCTTKWNSDGTAYQLMCGKDNSAT